MNSFVRASEETFRTVALGTLVGTKDRCLLGEPNRRRPTRPRPGLAPLPRRAPPRPDLLVVCPGFGLGRSWNKNTYTNDITKNEINGNNNI